MMMMMSNVRLIGTDFSLLPNTLFLVNQLEELEQFQQLRATCQIIQ